MQVLCENVKNLYKLKFTNIILTIIGTENNPLGLPVPYTFVADKTFPLKTWLTTPIPGKILTIQHHINIKIVLLVGLQICKIEEEDNS